MGFTYRSKLSGGAASSSVTSGVIEANHTIRALSAGTITITGASNTTPIVITAVAHGLVTGDAISISGITGNTNANGYFKITKLTADTFSLQNYSTGADIAGNGAYGGTPVAVTGIVQANRVLVENGTPAAPSIAFASAPGVGFMLNSGVARFYSGGFYGQMYMGFLSLAIDTSTIQFGASTDLTISRAAAATLQLGAAASATPVAQTLQAQGSRGGTDTDVAGANLTIRPGAGTGAATASQIIFQTPTVTASGTTAQTQTQRLSVQAGGLYVTGSVYPSSTDTYYSGTSTLLWQNTYVSRAILGSKTKTFTNNTKTGFVTIAVPSSTVTTGTIIYEIFVADATNTQAISGELKFSAAANSSGAVTAGTTADAFTPLNPCTSGTLTNAITQTTGTNTLTIEFQPNTSLTSTTREIHYRINSPGTMTITPL